MHGLLVNKMQQNVTKGRLSGNLINSIKTKDLFISKALGACHCQLIMLFITLEDIPIVTQTIKIIPHMHGQLDRQSLCCHLNSMMALMKDF